MQHRRVYSLLLALMLCLSLTPVLATTDQSGITDLKAVTFSSTQIKVTWKGEASAYQVFYQPVKGSFDYYQDVYTNSAMLYVSPQTDYQITVQAVDGTPSKPVYASTPKGSTQREYNFKYRTITFYTTTGGSFDNFFEDSSRTRVDRVQGALMAGAGEARNYYMVVDFSLARSKQDKDLYYVLVMTPPGTQDRLVDHGEFALPGNWTSAQYAFNLNNLLLTHVSQLGEMTPGRYPLELFINGWQAGSAVLIVE